MLKVDGVRPGQARQPDNILTFRASEHRRKTEPPLKLPDRKGHVTP
jgi:hypothetical protein